MSSWPTRLSNWIWRGSLVIIIGLPFHVLAYSLLHAHAGSLSGPFRDWKEALTLVLDLAAVALIIVRGQLRSLWRWDLVAIGLFVLLHIIFMFGTSDRAAALLAVKVNVVFLLLYAAALWAPPLTQDRQRVLLFALLIPAGLVGIFGLLQWLALPRDFLIHLGYGFGTNLIRPFELIQNSKILRVQSIMFGPNQYGSYLALPLILATWLAATRRRWRVRLGASILAIVLALNLYAAQSRSAWIGGAAGLITLGWLLLGWRGRLVAVGLVAVIAVVVGLNFQSLSHSKWSFVLRHDAPNSVGGVESTDTLHVQRLREGIHKVKVHPLGEGLTAAGRASDLVDESFYTENFYLQVADQVGVEGLFLFLAIVVIVGAYLWQSTEPLALPLLAALVGLSVMNLFAHTWSDGATALLWWGAAGLVLAPRESGHA